MSDESAVVDEAVDDGGGDVVVSKDGAPAAEFDVGGDDEAVLFVGAGDDLVEESSAVGVDGEVAKFVYCKETKFLVEGEFFVESAFVFGFPEGHDQISGGRETGADPC